MVQVCFLLRTVALLTTIYARAGKTLSESELYPRTFNALGSLPNENFSYPVELDDETLQRTELLLSDVDQLIVKYGTKKYDIGKKKYTPKPPSGTDRRKIYYQHYLKLFGQNDEGKMRQLKVFRFGIGPQNLCYMKAYGTFLQHCFYAYYERGGLRPMRNLLANACDAHWLNAEKINDILQRTCQWKFQYILQR